MVVVVGVAIGLRIFVELKPVAGDQVNVRGAVLPEPGPMEAVPDNSAEPPEQRMMSLPAFTTGLVQVTVGQLVK